LTRWGAGDGIARAETNERTAPITVRAALENRRRDATRD
jgi:hypothetical protein